MAERFVWQTHLRQDVLDDAMAEPRALSYEALQGISVQPLRKKVRGRDQKVYDLVATADLVEPGSQDLEITVRLKRGWFGATLTDSFLASAPPSSETPAVNDDDDDNVSDKDHDDADPDAI
jgi:hypothetical protein